MHILLLTPPLTQLNTPYPATAYLTGFLRKYTPMFEGEGLSLSVTQADPAIELVLRLLSAEGLKRVLKVVQATVPGKKSNKSDSLSHFVGKAKRFLETIDPVVRFLQGRDPSLALRIAGGGFLPEGPRFEPVRAMMAQAEIQGDGGLLHWAFGQLGIQDRAKHYASLYIDDLADAIRDGIDPRFELSKYGEKLAASAPSFDPLAAALAGPRTLVDEMLDEITAELMEKHRPDVVGLSVPFPGNVYGAFRIAQVAKHLQPGVKVVLGGGYCNTELRTLNEPRVFDHVDYITLDDGERPTLNLLLHLAGKRGEADLVRTYLRDASGTVCFIQGKDHDIPLKDAGTPSYDGLPVDRYLSLCEMLNPMHRIWSDGRWNKLTLAHGCYWRKCSFCDTSLDYIGRYEEQAADEIVDRIVQIMGETGQSGFHFVDEAAPPKILFKMAERLIERGVVISWWGNIRFEKSFTPKMCQLLAASGLIAVSGGLEVADPRLLTLMNKGVSVDQVARVTRAFADAGVLVHAYLMYGFPTQTVQETVDALERVRQLFEAQCIHSAFWHRFSATIHSPIGKSPETYGIRLLPMPRVTFAQNDLEFLDPSGVDHDRLGVGLRKALYNYMHGVCLEDDVRGFFDGAVPRPKVPRNLIAAALH